MRKHIFTIIILIISIVALLVSVNLYIKSGTIIDEAEVINKYCTEKPRFPLNGVITDKKTAINVAIPIWTSIYGELDNEDYAAEYDKKLRVWHVYGVLPKNYLGGVPNILIQKSNGKIIAVWHTK